jgi:nuclear pore complex protein Nup107
VSTKKILVSGDRVVFSLFADVDLDFERQPPLISAEDHEDILHPLREAANRVGREVERFAEVLDEYNPQRATEQDEKQGMLVDLIEEYHNIALDTVKRLQEKHASERQKRDGLRWREKVTGRRNSHDDDEMDMEDSDDHESPLPDLKTTIDDLERWEQEAQTWDLLGRLVSLRTQSGVGDSSAQSTSKLGPIHQYSTEREIWEKFLATDDLALERKTVLEWLKDSADESGEDIDILVQDLQQNADRGDIIAHGWLHTKAALKKHKLLSSGQGLHQNSSKTEELVTELDPDAMTRQKRKLEHQDEYFERSIWLGCYEMLRRGKSPAELKEWCTERTEVWRAISMSGFPDEDWKDDQAQMERGNFEANSLWRRMCFALARKGGGDDYERAVYGILSGDILSVEPICRTWDDFLFIHYNALLRTQFDNFIQQLRPFTGPSNNISNLGAFDAVQFHGDPESAGKRLIDTIRSDPRTQKESMLPMKMLQGVLIADSFPNFIYHQGLALSKFANAKGVSNLIPPNKQLPENEDIMNYITLDDHDSLRVLAHMLIVFMGLGIDLGGIFRETEVENVIVAYVSFLRLSGKEELIPLYCSQLSGKRKYAILCRNLIDVTNHDQRVTQIQLMKELGLDVQEFVGLQARFLLSDYKDTVQGYPATGRFNLFDNMYDKSFIARKVRPDFFGEDPDKVERVDMLLIRSLEWYLLVEGLWSETFAVGTMLYLRFFSMHIPWDNK